MKDFKVFTIRSNPFIVDLISGAMWELDILGINELEDCIKVSAYEDSYVSHDEIEKILRNLIEQNLIESFKISEEILRNQNWNEEWEQKVNIIEVGDKIVIKPTFKDYKSNNEKIILNIDPKMSFGTGEHQTTKIMLKLCERHIRKGDKVLDVGSGTGILAIASSKLGAGRVFAVDNDEWCYINAKENIINNNINNIVLINGTILDIFEKDFDIVLANINLNVILDIKDSLGRLIKNSGKLIISGILEKDMYILKRQFVPKGLTAVEYENIDEWLGLVLKKN